ncbi:MAG: O-antigen ligase family protein [Chloroflexi bacterium]|nr:MAG: O-antigen ligase family protein [Chloroflexota bacterium]
MALLIVSIFAQGSGTLNVVDLAGSSGVAADSTQGRLEIWSRALYAIQDFPFTGMGLNTFRTVVHLLYPLFIIPPGLDIAHAHNEFLQAALDLGLPGLVAFLALYLTTFWMLRELWESPATMGIERALWRTIILGLTGGLLAHAVFGLTDAIAFGARPGVLFWMLLALTTGLFLQVPKAQVRG